VNVHYPRVAPAPPRVHLFGKKKVAPLPGSPPLLLASARLAATCSSAPSAPRLSSARSSVPSAPTSLVAPRGRRDRGKGRRRGRCHRGRRGCRHGRRRGRCHREQGLRRPDLSGGAPQSRGKLGFSLPTGTAAATPRIDPPSPSGIDVVEVVAVILGRHRRTTTPPSEIATVGSGSPPSGIAVAFRDCRRRLPFAPRSHTMPFSSVILPPPMLCALLILCFCLCSCSN
jgi:hypothetical protein